MTSWYMSAAAKGWLPGIKSIVGFWSSAASLIEHNDQQPTALEIGILDQRTNVPVEPLVDLLQCCVIAASCFSAGFRIIVSVIMDIRHDERIIRECAISQILFKVGFKGHEIGFLLRMVSGSTYNGREIRKRIMTLHVSGVVGSE